MKRSDSWDFVMMSIIAISAHGFLWMQHHSATFPFITHSLQSPVVGVSCSYCSMPLSFNCHKQDTRFLPTSVIVKSGAGGEGVFLVCSRSQLIFALTTETKTQSPYTIAIMSTYKQQSKSSNKLAIEIPRAKVLPYKEYKNLIRYHF